jgi:hypothetical protein
VIHEERLGPGRPRETTKISPAVRKAINVAIARAINHGRLEIQDLADPTCRCESALLENGERIEVPCEHDPYPFCGRSWLNRARHKTYEDGVPYMNREHARCILHRAERLGAFTREHDHRIRILIAHDEPAPIPPTIAVFPGAAKAVATEVARIACDALPAIGHGMKRKALEAALSRYFESREVHRAPLWEQYDAPATAWEKARAARLYTMDKR